MTKKDIFHFNHIDSNINEQKVKANQGSLCVLP